MLSASDRHFSHVFILHDIEVSLIIITFMLLFGLTTLTFSLYNTYQLNKDRQQGRDQPWLVLFDNAVEPGRVQMPPQLH